MSLVTGKEIKGSRFERTRLSQLDIRRVHELAEAENQPENFEFYYRDMSVVEDGGDPEDASPPTGVDADGHATTNPDVIDPPGAPLKDPDEESSYEDSGNDGSSGDGSSYKDSADDDSSY